MNQTNEARRKRVVFRSHHTGMKENDLLFGSFVDAHLAALSDDEVAWLEWLLMTQELDHTVMHRLLSFQFKP